MRAICLAVLVAGASAPSASSEDFNVPPARVFPEAFGMGDAQVADGAWFNASALNPALLRSAPRRYEVLGLEGGLSSDLLPTVKYLKDNKAAIRDIYKNLKRGLATGDTAKISAGLDQVQSIVDRVADKPYGVEAGPAAALRLGEHWGFQFYNQTHMAIEASAGDLTKSALAIPRPINLADPALNDLVNTLFTDIQRGINQVLTDSEQAALGKEVNAFLNGINDQDTFLANVATMTASVDINTLKQAIVNSISSDLATVLVVGYSDSVFMGTYAFEPFLDALPDLTLGVNLKMVNRKITIKALAPQDMKGNVTGHILRDLKRQQTTRFGMDLGLLYRYTPWRLRVGLSAEDVVRNRVSAKGADDDLVGEFVTDPGPLVLRGGVSWSPWRPVTLNLDMDDMLNNTLYYTDGQGLARVKAGVQLTPVRWLALRGGAGNKSWTAGWGLMVPFVALDYAYARDNLSQRRSHMVQFRLAFGGGPDAEGVRSKAASKRGLKEWRRNIR